MGIDPIIIGKIVQDRDTLRIGRIVDIQYTKKSKLNVAVFFPGEEIFAGGKSGWELQPEDAPRSVWYAQKSIWGVKGRKLRQLKESALKEYTELQSQEVPSGGDLTVREKRHVVRTLFMPESVEVLLDETPTDGARPKS